MNSRTTSVRVITSARGADAMPPRRWHHETGGELAHIVSSLLHGSGPPPVLVGITACMVCTALSSLGVGRWHEKMWRQRRADADVLASALRREAEEEILNASMAASSAMDTARDESDMSFVVESADDEDETMSIRGSETSASEAGSDVAWTTTTPSSSRATKGRDFKCAPPRGSAKKPPSRFARHSPNSVLGDLTNVGVSSRRR